MTGQSKAEPLDAERRSIGAGRLPLNGASQGDQGKRAETLSAGQRGKSTGCRAAGAIVALARSAQEGARASKYFLHKRTTPTDEL